MGASAHIGRVGALAVALGVGAAVATGQGIASASPTDTNSSTADVESETTQDSTAGSSTVGTTPAEPTSVSAPAGSAVRSPSRIASRITSAVTSVIRTAQQGQAMGNGGALTSKRGTANAEPEGVEPEKKAVGDIGVPEPVKPEVFGAAEVEVAAPPGQMLRPQRKSNRLSAGPVESSVRSLEARTPPTQMRTVKVAQRQVAQEVVALTELAAPVISHAFSGQPTAPSALSFIAAGQDAGRVIMAAPEATTPKPTIRRVLTNVLKAIGIGAFSTGAPGGPLGSPLAMAVLALGARREAEQTVSTVARTAEAPTATLAMGDLSTAAVTTTYPGTTRTPVAVSGNTHFIEYVTGPGNLNNTTSRFGIGGTDLGIMWDNGTRDNPATAIDEHQVLIAFGDTFSNYSPVRTGVWRFNTLFRSADDTLSNGLYVPNGVPVRHWTAAPNAAHFSGSPMEYANWSDPILPSPGQPVRPPYAIGTEVTLIPTAGISSPYENQYGSRQYMSFMSVRSWDTPGRWTTNYSGIAYSDDNGQTWRIAPTSIRTAASGRATVPYVSGNQNFQQGAFVKPPAGSPDADAGWLYSYGTPAGRGGTVYLSRVHQDQILDATKYQYWNGSTWVTNKPSAAAPILPGTTTSFFGFAKRTTYPTVSEMSVQYNPYLNKYVMLYGDNNNNIVMRTATSPQGPWSTPKTLVTSTKMPGQYAPYIHPWSGTDYLSEAEQQYLYWNLSTWNDYQVRLMRTDLTKV